MEEVQEIVKDEKKPGLFKKGLLKAEEMLTEPDKILELCDKVHLQLSTEDVDKVPILVEIVKAYIKKEYTKIPFKSVAAIVGALVYFITPLKKMPKFSKLDKASVVLGCWKMIKKDIDAYVVWKASTDNIVIEG